MTDNLLTAARSQIRGLAELDEARARLQKALFAASAALVPPVNVDSALEEVIAGGEIPNLGAAIATMQARITARNQQIEMLQSMLTTVGERRREIHVTGADDALAYLAGQLELLLAEAWPYLVDLREVTTAAEAIDQDRVEQWTATGQLADRYAGLRETQAVLVTAALFPPEDSRIVDHARSAGRALVQSFGTLRNYGELYPDPGWWELTDQAQQDRKRRDHLGKAIPPAPWLTDDPRANLAYIASEEADPWVPGIREMQAAKTAREEAGREPKAALRPGERRIGPPKGKTLDPVMAAREYEWNRPSTIPSGVDVP